jgi:hypothetical protein
MKDAETAAAALLGLLCLFLIVAIVIFVFYLLTLQKALSRVAPRNRLMEPGLVWLSLIPIFDLIWRFFIATWVPDSLRNEFQDRGRDDGSDYGKRIGLARAIIGVLYFFVNLVGYGPSRDPAMGIIFLPLGLISLALFIIFWVRIAGYSRELAALPYNFERVPDYVGHDDRELDPRGPSSDAIRPADPGTIRPEDRDRC